MLFTPVVHNQPLISPPPSDRFVDLCFISGDIVIRQNPLGNVVVLITSALKLDQAILTSEAGRLAKQYISAVVPVAKGVAVVNDGEMVILIHTPTHNLVHVTPAKYMDGIFPVFTSQELKSNDMLSVLDAMSTASDNLSNRTTEIIQSEYDKLKDVTSHQLLGYVELSVSLSSIYRECAINLYQNNKPMTIRDEMSELNQIDGQFVKLACALEHANSAIHALRIQLTRLNDKK